VRFGSVRSQRIYGHGGSVGVDEWRLAESGWVSKWWLGEQVVVGREWLGGQVVVGREWKEKSQYTHVDSEHCLITHGCSPLAAHMLAAHLQPPCSRTHAAHMLAANLQPPCSRTHAPHMLAAHLQPPCSRTHAPHMLAGYPPGGSSPTVSKGDCSLS
jgi:hypothetical protein